MLLRLMGALCALVAAANPGLSAEKSDSVALGHVVPLSNGPNSANLLGDATKAEVFVSRRGNGNAHGFSTGAFYLFVKTQEHDDLPTWLLVPFFGGPDDSVSGREIFLTPEGASCTLRDIRLIESRGKPATVVVGLRELGETFADPAPVHFDYYHVVHDKEAAPGRPEYYLEHVKNITARQSYCDVNIAFDRELGLGRHGLVASDQNGE